MDGAVATRGYKVVVATAVDATQSLGHGPAVYSIVTSPTFRKNREKVGHPRMYSLQAMWATRPGRGVFAQTGPLGHGSTTAEKVTALKQSLINRVLNPNCAKYFNGKNPFVLLMNSRIRDVSTPQNGTDRYYAGQIASLGGNAAVTPIGGSTTYIVDSFWNQSIQQQGTVFLHELRHQAGLTGGTSKDSIDPKDGNYSTEYANLDKDCSPQEPIP